MTKEAIQEYLNEVNEKLWNNDKKMQDYIKKECSDVYKTSGGQLILFEKPRIKKDFCFGHGQNGISTDEETNAAFESAQYARTNEGYFLKENLEWFDEWMEMLNGHETLYLVPQHYKPTRVACIRSEYYFRRYEWERDKIIEELSAYDIEELKKVVLSEKEKFVKRLNTYLKRYGLSKIHSWTYLVD